MLPGGLAKAAKSPVTFNTNEIPQRKRLVESRGSCVTADPPVGGMTAGDGWDRPEMELGWAGGW